MNLKEALSASHDLTNDRVAEFCQYVNLDEGADTICSLRLSRIVTVGRNNDRDPLDFLSDRIGVYAFRLRGRVIYVGECGTKTRSGSQDLQDRISQHLCPNDAGATLRDNWYKCHGCDFRTFQKEMRQCRLWTVSFPRTEDTQKIARLEHLLIGVLGPEYCNVPGSLNQNHIHR